ncbi:unnamed protein product [Closterium sp. NIES-53]
MTTEFAHVAESGRVAALVERTAPHSSSFPPTTAPLQTLHMDVWGPVRVTGQGDEHYFLLVVDDYTHYTTDLLVLRLHSDRGVLAQGLSSCAVLPEVTFDESVCFYRLHPHRSSPVPLPHLSLPPPPVAPLPPHGPTLSGVSQETLSLQELRAWGVRWGSPGGGARGAGTGGAVATGAGGSGGATTQQQLSALCHLLSLPPAVTEFPIGGTTTPLLFPPPDQSQPQLLPHSPLPDPYIAVTESLAKSREHASCPAMPVHTRRAVQPRPPHVLGMHIMALRPSSVPHCVVLPLPPGSSLPHVPEPESDLVCAASPTVTCLLAMVVTDLAFSSPAASALVAELVDFAALCRLDYDASLVIDFSCPLSLKGELAFGSDVLEDTKFELECLSALAPHLASMLLCPEGDPDALEIPTPRSYANAITVQRDYELQSLDFSTAFLQGSLHEAILLRNPSSFTGFFPKGTQWSLRRPVHDLCQAPCKWHNTLRATLAALGFAPSIAESSLFLHTETSLPPFYVLVYIDDLVFAIADSEALALVKAELLERHTCTDLGELCSYLGLQITWDRARCTITVTQSHMVHQVLQHFGFQFLSLQPTPLPTRHSLSSPPLDESVEPSGPYPQLVGCLMYLMTCEAEIYAGAMAPQELRWVTYLVSDLGERPRSPPLLYVDNKAMIALYQDQRPEHRTKHIALCYFLMRELQQCGQLRLAYVASQANTSNVFTKALGSGDY